MFTHVGCVCLYTLKLLVRIIFKELNGKLLHVNEKLVKTKPAFLPSLLSVLHLPMALLVEGCEQQLAAGQVEAAPLCCWQHQYVQCCS